jgi:hypothetical protein
MGLMVTYSDMMDTNTALWGASRLQWEVERLRVVTCTAPQSMTR